MSEHDANSRRLTKCAHKTCVCLVEPGESYCSQYCEHTDDKEADAPLVKADECQCGHPECK